MAKKKDDQFRSTAESILSDVGGRDNVTSVTHCMTRLRFLLKDQSLADLNAIEKVPGVAGVQISGGELQVIIGLEVGNVYSALCEIGGFQPSGAIDENLDDRGSKPKTKVTPGSIGTSIMNALSGSLTPLIPVIMAGSLFRLLAILFGPQMLNLLPDTSNFIILCTFVADAAFYFLPFVVGYTSAKYFGFTPVLGIYIAGVFMAPALMQMATDGTPFSVFGIPASPQNYANSVFPAFLTVWVMSYVEKFFIRHLPTVLKTVFAPFLTMVIALPVGLCALGPLGAWLGNLINNSLLGLADAGGIGAVLATALIAAFWQLFVLTGMHQALIAALISFFATNGSDGVIMPGLIASGVACYGMVIGFMLRVKDPEERSLCVGYLVAGLIGGVTEPSMYGVGVKYRKPFIGMVLGGLVGGILMGVLHVKAYTFVPIANFFLFTNFAGGPASNFVLGSIVVVLTVIAAAVITYFFGVPKAAVRKEIDAEAALEMA